MNRGYRARNQEKKDYNTRKMAALGKGVSWWWWGRLAPPPDSPPLSTPNDSPLLCPARTFRPNLTARPGQALARLCLGGGKIHSLDLVQRGVRDL